MIVTRGLARGILATSGMGRRLVQPIATVSGVVTTQVRRAATLVTAITQIASGSTKPSIETIAAPSMEVNEEANLALLDVDQQVTTGATIGTIAVTTSRGVDVGVSK